MTQTQADRCIEWMDDVIGVHMDMTYNKPFDEHLEAINDAEFITACIERSVPKKVVYKMGCHGGALCPICRTMFERDWSNWKSPFCQYCGQALDWGEVE